jgi:putative ABC transport system permease protein
MVIVQGMRLAIAGLAIGLVGSLGFGRLLASMLYGVSPTDLLTFALMSVALMGVAMLANYIPARRAAKIDPIVALRYE